VVKSQAFVADKFLFTLKDLPRHIQPWDKAALASDGVAGIFYRGECGVAPENRTTPSRFAVTPVTFETHVVTSF
jgi:hypothetical protein